MGLTSWEHFHYLNQGNAGYMNNMDDAAEFDATQKALSTLGIPVSIQWSIFKICAALLHIGNININREDDDACSISDTDPGLMMACRLLELNQGQFKKWLTTRQIVTRGESFMKPLKAVESLNVRDSVAKFMYVNFLLNVHATNNNTQLPKYIQLHSVVPVVGSEDQQQFKARFHG
jgi:myosin-5